MWRHPYEIAWPFDYVDIIEWRQGESEIDCSVCVHWNVIVCLSSFNLICFYNWLSFFCRGTLKYWISSRWKVSFNVRRLEGSPSNFSSPFFREKHAKMKFVTIGNSKDTTNIISFVSIICIALRFSYYLRTEEKN